MILALGFCGILGVRSVSAAEITSDNVPAPPIALDAGESQVTDATPLLDQHPGALAAYSLRRLSSTYDGPALRIRRISDGAEQNIGFDGIGMVNTLMLEAFCIATDCRVTTWYSQLTGVPDAIQSKPELQPLVVQQGKVVRDEGGYVALRFQNLGSSTPSTYLAVSGMPEYSSHDVTAFTVADNRGDYDGSGWLNLLVLQTAGERGYQATRLQINSEGIGNISVGDGTASTQNTGVPFSLGRFTYAVRVSPTAVAGYRNQNLLLSTTHTRSAYLPRGLAIGGDSRDGGAGLDGHISEVVLYPELDDQNLLEVYDNINAAWQTGPQSYSTTTLLPQDWEYQIQLYSWLQTVTLADVQIDPGPLKWDGSFSGADDLAQLWLSLSNSPKAELATRGDACWFVLDDGNGCGIEATGIVRLYYKGDASNTGAYGVDPAFWYQLNVSLADGGQGNPYFGDPAVARRALAISMVEMMMWDREIERTQSARRNDYYGKALSSWAYVYYHCKDVLDTATQAAFEKGLERFLDHTIRLGAHDINTNMDMFFVHGAAGVYAGVDDPAIKAKAIQAVRRVLFGHIDGDLNGRYDVIEGAFFPAGYIGEADGPEATYNGHSFAQLVGALSWVHEDPEWDFLKEVVRRMAAFKLVQYFKDPPAAAGKIPFYEGPSGYANRTGGSYVRDQGQDRFRDLTAATLVKEARPLMRSYKNGRSIPTAAEMATELNRSIERINAAEFATLETSTPPVFSAYSSWPAERAYLPPTGWYSTLKGLLDTDDPTIYTPYDRPGYYFSTAFGDEQTGTEFWAHKATDGLRDFGFFVETDAQQGPYKGWYGGKLEAFWTSETGILILNRKNKSGCNPSDHENSTCWNEVETWAAHHVWGRDEAGKGFSTAQIRGEEVSRTSVVSASDVSPNAEVVNVFNDPNASGSNTGEESGAELAGAVTIKNRFEALSNGVLVSHIVTSDGTDQAKELWATLPVYLRWNYASEGGQALLEDATIEYWNGASWKPLGTSLVSTSKLRIGRTYLDGKGARYGYVGFVGEDGKSSTSRRVKLSSAVWEQSYQGYARIRNVHIDLHGNPGTAKAFPASASVSYAITTTDPGTTQKSLDPRNHEVTLTKGWNIVASPVAPSDSSLSAIFGSSGQVVLVKDREGRVYSSTMAVDQINEWNWREAYMAYAEGEARIRFAGEVIPAGTSIPLNKGWNLLPYTRSTAGPVSEYLTSVSAQAVLVKDQDGGIYDPEHQIDTIKEMQPGEGYWIYMEEAGVLVTPP